MCSVEVVITFIPVVKERIISSVNSLEHRHLSKNPQLYTSLSNHSLILENGSLPFFVFTLKLFCD